MRFLTPLPTTDLQPFVLPFFPNLTKKGKANKQSIKYHVSGNFARSGFAPHRRKNPEAKEFGATRAEPLGSIIGRAAMTSCPFGVVVSENMTLRDGRELHEPMRMAFGDRRPIGSVAVNFLSLLLPPSLPPFRLVLVEGSQQEHGG